jgi:hypothetical protein
MTKTADLIGIRETPVEIEGGARRIGVFIDYWYAYTSARQLFAEPGVPPPAWFGNVSPPALGRMLVKSAPPGTRRSQRTAAGVHLFVRHFDPEVHRGQLERVRRWELDDATVTVAPSREEGAGHWQSSLSVALACAVVDALDTGRIDTAVVFAGDGALLPLFGQVGGATQPSQRIELATWVGADGSVPTTLVSAPAVWCHRLGAATFRLATDDRRPPRPTNKHAATHPRPAHPPATAMAAALTAAGVTPRALAQAPSPAPATEQPDLQPPTPAVPPRGVRGLAHRLFGRDA